MPVLPVVQPYPALVRGVHWITLLLIAGAFVLIFWATSMPFTPEGDSLTNWHRTLGITIWLLAVPRLVWRLVHGAPPPDPSLPAWQERLALLTHWALYVLLVLQPILGYLDSNLWGVDVLLFDRIKLPALIGEMKPLNEYIDAVHVYAGWLMLLLIGMHSAAALYHHFWRRDNVMRRMLPSLGG
jgi:cytochrome b561